MPVTARAELCTFGDFGGGSVTSRTVYPRSFEVNVNITEHYLEANG